MFTYVCLNVCIRLAVYFGYVLGTRSVPTYSLFYAGCRAPILIVHCKALFKHNAKEIAGRNK